ncbi:MAG: hypothetical protein ACO22K_13175 [Woeseiaceae bacterium]|jgi:hypothetical protein
MNANAGEPGDNSAHWILLRDIGVLQLKLLVDGFRDLVLLPASLIAGLVSLVKGENGKPGPQFYQLLALGKQSERWINLFGALDNSAADLKEDRAFGEMDIDEIVSRVESFVVEEYQSGGLTAHAKERIDKALETLQRKHKKSAGDETRQL